MTGSSTKAFVLGLVLVLAASIGRPSLAALGEEPKAGETVSQYLTPEILQQIFPGADRIGEVTGTPPAATVFKQDKAVGYLFSTWDVTQSTGFSNRPIVLLVGVDLTAHISGARLVHHSEPIAILGLKDEQFHHFIEGYRGHDLTEGVDVVSELSSSVLGAGSFSQRLGAGASASVKVDAVSRATTSSVLMSDAVVRGGRIVARSRGLLSAPGTGGARIDVDRFAPADWPALAAAGAIAQLHLSYGDVRAKFAETGATRAIFGDPTAAANDVFLDLYVALVTPAGIGVNLLGDTWYNQYTAGRAIDDQLLLIVANGATSFLGADWEHAEVIGPIELAQGGKTIRLSGKQVKTLPFLHAKKAPELSERALIFLHGSHDLDPSQPWQVHLLISGKSGGEQAYARFDVNYRLPEEYVLKPAPGVGGADAAGRGRSEGAIAWQAIWSAHWAKIGILGLGLVTLTVIFIWQDALSRRRRLHRWVRVGFLSWTLVWLGWYAGAQLTVVNLITYLHSLVTDFRWDYLLADPLISILSAFTLVGLVLWGRAPFCGWLCPFGALQELANMAARWLRLPQVTVPRALHERLVLGKYILFLGLLGASFASWDLAMAGAEVEPFKAAIILRFMTEWPMVAYAAALVAASLFVERFYCRFACPLGGGLAIFGRFHRLNSLKRHPQCGTRCHICEAVCPVGAIARNGQINMSECFYCLDCQVTYNDDKICPPLVWRRRRSQEPAFPRRASAEVTSSGDGLSP